MDIIIKGAQLLLSLSILVILHEAGHYWAARLTKTKVEKFYLFFNPWFSLFKKKIGDTEYGIGWVPLGGFVKISGMVDESMDMKQMKEEPKDYEFRSKKTGQKLLMMAGGVIINIILAGLIFGLIEYTIGKKFTDNKSLKEGFYFHETLKEFGFKDGDKIIKIDGEEVKYVEQISKKLILNGAESAIVLRNGEEKELKFNEDFKLLMFKMNKLKQQLLSPIFEYKISGVVKNTVAEDIGLKKEDKIILVNNNKVSKFHLLTQELKKNKLQEVEIKILRNKDTITKNAIIPENSKLGIQIENTTQFKTISIKEGFFSSMIFGFYKTYEFIAIQVSAISKMFDKRVDTLDNLGGFIAIGNIFPNEWNWVVFWTITASLSAILAFMNILPIPGLDGGHILILLIETIIRRPLPVKALSYIQTAGMIFLIGLIVIINGNDIYKFIIKPNLG